MKRKHCPQYQNDLEEPRTNRKRFARAQPTFEALPCKFRLLKQWELTEEASRYLSISGQIELNQVRDKTSPQLAMVPYQPNRYQQIIDQIAALSDLFAAEPMDIEEVEVLGS